MANLERLFSRYDRLLLFDTETTGLDFRRDQIIEFAAVAVEAPEGVPKVTAQYDRLVTLAPGTEVPPQIQQLTGISTQDIARSGIPKAQVCADIGDLIAGNTLLLAYNAHFDLSFLYYLLRPLGRAAALVPPRFLDLLTVYRDRRDYPHRLSDAIAAYGLGETAVNSHRAVDDARAALALLEAMETERDDLDRYLDLFGTHPKYGRAGKGIASVTYRPQSFRRTRPLYEMEEV